MRHDKKAEIKKRSVHDKVVSAYMKDTIHKSTPLGWAEYCGKERIAEYLRGVRQRAD